MALIKLRNHDIVVEAVSAGDATPEDAIKMAEQLSAEGFEFDKALVDRFSGLVLIGSKGTYHFNTLICGYIGERPRATAQILHLFDFGSVPEMWAKVNHGNSMGKAVIYR